MRVKRREIREKTKEKPCDEERDRDRELITKSINVATNLKFPDQGRVPTNMEWRRC